LGIISKLKHFNGFVVEQIKCPHCNFEADYESYLEIMKEQAINMASDYIPDRPGF